MKKSAPPAGKGQTLCKPDTGGSRTLFVFFVFFV
jgi:hypothetical protein